VTEHRLTPGQSQTVHGAGGGSRLPLLQQHGDMPSLGFRLPGGLLMRRQRGSRPALPP
jgi:hypothetical protein